MIPILITTCHEFRKPAKSQKNEAITDITNE